MAAPTVVFDAPPDMVKAVAEMRRAVREKRRSKGTKYATPGALAAALNPATVQTPALQLIDNALVDVAEGRCNRLIISMAPQEGKSERTTRYGSLWMLHRNPNLRIGIVSYGDANAETFSGQVRNDVITFTGEDDTLDLGLRLHPGNRAISRWNLERPHRGGVYAVGIGGALTGRALDVMFIDDPVKDYKAADSMLLSEQAWRWWMSVARPRIGAGPCVLILTRWHENDLAGRLLAKQKTDEEAGLEHYDRWRVINIPAQAGYDPAKGESDPLGREPGEFMLSARGRTTAQWETTKTATAPRIWSALFQGRPSPESGDVWQRQWWRRYESPLWSQQPDGSFLVEGMDELIQSWDLAFKDTKSADYVVGQVWARRGAETFLLDQLHARLSFTATLAAIKRMTTRWPGTTAKLIEDKANGPAVIDSLRAEIPGIIPVTPHDSKYARATAVSPFIRAGNASLPADAIALFDVQGLIDEAAAFPNGAHDDQVDTTSQALAKFYLNNSGAEWLRYMQQQIAKNTAAAEAEEAAIAVATQSTDPREAARRARHLANR